MINTMGKSTTKRSTKEKIKNFWKRFNENWLWVNLGAFVAGAIIFWGLYFIGSVSLMTAMFSIILNPIILVLTYYFVKYFRVSKHQTIFMKIILVGFGTMTLGGIIWLFTGYVFITAPWAPLQGLPAILRGRILQLVVISSYALAAYIMYRIGKKREWRPPSHLID